MFTSFFKGHGRFLMGRVQTRTAPHELPGRRIGARSRTPTAGSVSAFHMARANARFC